MKYGDIVLQSIRKMFLNNEIIKIEDLEQMKKDKKYKVYMDDIHLTINNAINILLNKCIPYIKQVNVSPNFEIATLKDFKYIDSIYTHSGKKMPYRVDNGVLKISEDGVMNYNATYQTTKNTLWDEILPIPYIDCTLIPLYVAGELYKDDDLTLSTMYLNQFEQEINKVTYQTTEISQIEDIYGGF